MPHLSPTAALGSLRFKPRISESKRKTVVESVSGSQVVLVVVACVASTEKTSSIPSTSIGRGSFILDL